MAEPTNGLNFKDAIKLNGNLILKGEEGGVFVDGTPVLVEIFPTDPPQCKTAPPVMLPPPPTGPADSGQTVWIVNSFNKTVTAKGKPIVALGMVMQGSAPTWPGMMLQGSSKVTISGVAINVLGDTATIFPSGGSAKMNSSSGQP